MEVLSICGPNKALHIVGTTILKIPTQILYSLDTSCNELTYNTTVYTVLQFLPYIYRIFTNNLEAIQCQYPLQPI